MRIDEVSDRLLIESVPSDRLDRGESHHFFVV